MENTLDKKYTDLLQDILDNGVKKTDRTGTGTISVFGRQIKHKMSEGFPLLTTKKMPFKTITTELLWFLRGDTNIRYLVQNNCHIWNGDCYKNYLNNPAHKAECVADLMSSQAGQLVKYSTQEEFINKIKTDDEFACKWGELGPIYGKQWRKWDVRNTVNEKTGEIFIGNLFIDQIDKLINELKTNPDSRRLMVNAWNVGELDQMVLPPCHYGFQVYTRELTHEEKIKWRDNFILEQEKNNIIKEEKAKLEANGGPYILYTHSEGYFDWDKLIPKRAISLMWNQRSVDTFLGLPFNIASYGLLLEIIAKEVNMVPDELIGNLGDTHLYLNHIEQAKEQIGRKHTKKERVLMAYNKMMDIGEAFVFNDCISDDSIEKLGVPKRTREPLPLPKLEIKEWTSPENGNMRMRLIPTHLSSDEEVSYEISDFILSDYKSHTEIKAPLSN